jgi:membrane-bound metal-dependent hydrolase YbcI (DUF457 family)
MDSITHILAAALFCQPIASPPIDAECETRPVWRERFAILLGALLPDADGMLGLIDPVWYSKYHRVVTHSFVGLVALAFIIALLARRWPEKFILPFMRPKARGLRVIDPTYRRLLLFASISLVTHFILDWVTAWGIWPLWPITHADFALHRVNSLSLPICLFTLSAWGIQTAILNRTGNQARGAVPWIIATGWAFFFIAYVIIRPIIGPAAYV